MGHHHTARLSHKLLTAQHARKQTPLRTKFKADFCLEKRSRERKTPSDAFMKRSLEDTIIVG